MKNKEHAKIDDEGDYTDGDDRLRSMPVAAQFLYYYIPWLQKHKTIQIK